MRISGKNIAGLAGLVALIAVLQALPFREWLEPLFEWLEDSGTWGMAGFVLTGALLSLLFVPVSVFVFSSGMLFGVSRGFGLASLVLVLGSLLGFAVGRWLWPRIQHRSVFQGQGVRAIRRALESEGYTFIAWLRMTPVFHFMTGNIIFGSLNLKWVPYMVFSYLGMIPGTLLMTYAGSIAGGSLSDSEGVPVAQIVFFLLGFGVLILVGRRITLSTRKALQDADSKEISSAR
jgi:uncharacterized membrane protein YdjX (TVP38/TMEM64 family)